MNRDSQIWWWLMAGAILATLSSHFDLLEMCCALTDKTKALIELAGVIVGMVAAKMATSPLPGENDADKIGRR
jgi:hypothetical protein